MTIIIVKEEPSHYKDIRDITIAAFENHDPIETANIVEKLRDEQKDTLALVAIDNNSVIGHIMYSWMEVKVDDRDVKCIALAPLTVKPEYQRKGIGKLLTESSLKILRERGDVEAVIVLGHPEYYPKFGFNSDLAKHLQSPFGGGPSFMALELKERSLFGKSGNVKYANAFN